MGKSSSTLEEEIENWGGVMGCACVCVCVCEWVRVKEQTMKRKLGGMEMMEKRSGEML